MITASFLLIFLILAVYSYKSYIRKYRDVNKLPGPSILQALKELYFNSSSQSFALNLIKLNEKYGPTVKLWLNPLKPMIMTTDMEFCDKVFKSNDLTATVCFREMKHLGDVFFITPHYEKWKRHKSLIGRSVTREYIEKQLILYGRYYDNLLDAIGTEIGKPFDLQVALNETFLKLILRSLSDPSVELSEKELDAFWKWKLDVTSLLAEKLNSPRMFGVLHRLTKNYKSGTEVARQIQTFVGNWLGRLKDVEERSRDEHNLVYAMIDDGMTDAEIVETMNGFIQGGHDTAIFPIGMLFREMAERADLQQKILDEIWSTIGQDLAKPVTLNDIDKMSYLQAAIKEATRRYTPLPLMDRELIYDMTIGDMNIPKGTHVAFNFPGILTSEDNYDDPLAFRPERFLKGNVTPKSRRAFVGFGYGKKICPGKNLSYAVLKLLVVKVLREFEVRPVTPSHKIIVTADILLRSKTGLPVVFRKRVLNK